MSPSQPAAGTAALSVRLRPSRQLGLFLLAGHAGAAVLSWAASIPWWLSLGLSLAVATSLAFSLRHHALRSAADAVVAFELRPDGSGAVEDRRGRWSKVRVLGSSFVSPPLTILDLRLTGRRGRRALVVTPDALGAEEFRRLRVWLRWPRAPVDPGQANNPADT